jgi:hypothetical protein
MVLVVALHNLLEPCADVPRTMMLPVLKLCLYDVELRNHPLLGGEAPDMKSSAAREISAKVRESQKREGLGFPLATLLPVSDGEPPELDQTRLVRTTGSELSLMVFRNMSSSETTGNSSAALTQCFTEDTGLQRGIKVSAYSLRTSHSDSGGVCVFEA